MTIDLSKLKSGDTVTKFEDELRSAIANEDWATVEGYAHLRKLRQAAALLLEILPEIRGMVEATDKVANTAKSLSFMALQDAIQDRDDAVFYAMKPLTEKLKKAGVI